MAEWVRKQAQEMPGSHGALIAPTAADARRRAYDAAELIRFEGRQMRTDIAARAVDRAAAA